MSATRGVAARSIAALGRPERERDAAPLMATFADECAVGNVLAPEHFAGRAGARRC